MLNDGRCTSVITENKVDAFVKCAKFFGIDDFEEFLDDINFCEWESDFGHFLESYSNGSTLTVAMEIGSPLKLKEYVNLIS